MAGHGVKTGDAGGPGIDRREEAYGAADGPLDDDVLGDAAADADRLRDCARRMQAETGTAVCCDGRLEVRVDGYGTPVDLRIDKALMRLRPADVGGLVVDACAEAVQDLTRRQEEIFGELAG